MLSLAILGLFAILLLLLYKYIIHPSFLSPLSKIPSAHITSSIIPFQAWSRQSMGPNTHGVYAAHQKYGPILRLGPNEISCASATALRTIYQGGFEKDKMYQDVFVNFGTPPLFAMLGSKPHSAQKRLISNVYSKSFLQTSPDLQRLSEHLIYRRFLPIISSNAGQGLDMDVFNFSQAVAMDFMTSYLFGLSNGTDFINNVEYRNHWLEQFEATKMLLPHQRADGEVERSCLRLCEATESFLSQSQEGLDPSLITEPVVYARLSRGLARDANEKPSSRRILMATASEMLDHIIAGHETSAITLTYLMHELSKQPDLQTRLRDELLTLEPRITSPSSTDEPNNLPSPRSIDALPLLDSILYETLRLYAAGPARQPRITPHVPGGTTIEGYANIPGGVVVSSNAYTLHRNVDVFPQPDQWIPERWLDERPGKKDEIRRWFWAFSSGGRMCIGSNFAVQELKLLTAAIYTNYSTEIVDDEGIEQTDDYVARPAGGKLILRFRPV